MSAIILASESLIEQVLHVYLEMLACVRLSIKMTHVCLRMQWVAVLLVVVVPSSSLMALFSMTGHA